jgi:SAM-dependent methyltransferase
MTDLPIIFDRALLARRRDRAAADAGDHDFLLRRVEDDFAERLQIVTRAFPVAANLGAHNGRLERLLRSSGKIETIVNADASAQMLAHASEHSVVADEEALPFGDSSVDLVVSGLSLQLVNDLPGTLAQIRRVLKPDGLLLAALLGGATLQELREAWIVAEDDIAGGASPRVAPFADVRDMGALLQRAGFALPVVDSDVVTVTYASPLALMAEIKAMGASNMLAERRRAPVTRRLLAKASEVYEERFGTGTGRVRATFEILTLTAWSPHESQQKPLRPGSASARLADALGVPEQRIRRE